MSELRVIGPGSRSCGDCTACCTLAAVEELDKPEFVRCEHLDGGCTIYDDRPGSCRDWGCLWYHGYLRDRDRPDRSGIMFLPQKQGFNHSFGGQMVGAREVTGSASRMKTGEKVIRQLTRQGVSVMFKTPDGDSMIYPSEGSKALFHALLRKKGVSHSWRGRFFAIKKDN